MLMPISPRRVVTSARTPGRSGTGTLTSTVSSLDGTPVGRLTARFTSPFERLEQHVAVAAGDHPPDVTEGGDQAVEDLDDPLLVLGADIGPYARVAGRDPGHVPEAAGCQAKEGGVLQSGIGGQVHQGGGGEMGHVRYQGDHVVVAGGGQFNHVRPQLAHYRPDGGKRDGVGVGRGGQHPRGSFEHFRVGAVDPLLFGTGHGMAADEARMIHAVDNGTLDPRHIGHKTVRAGVDGTAGGLGHRSRRRGHECHQRPFVDTDLVHGPQFQGPGRSNRMKVRSGHMPPPLAQTEADRAADEPGADDLSPLTSGA